MFSCNLDPLVTDGEKFIARKPYAPAPAKKDGPRVNEEIETPQVLLIDAEGEKRGVVAIDEALKIAAASGLDLVEVSPTTKPPVCKILDYGKYKYQQQKKKTESR